MQGDGFHRNAPGYPPSRPPSRPPPPFFPEANVPGQGPWRGEYSNPLPYHAAQGEMTHPTNGVGRGHGGVHPQVPVPHGRQRGVGHGTPRQQPPTGMPVGQSPRFAFRQPPPPVQPTNVTVPHHPQPVTFAHVHQQNPEPMITTAAAGSQFQGSDGVRWQNVSGRPYYQDLILSRHNARSSPVPGSFPHFPDPSRRFDLTGELGGSPPPQMPVPQPFSHCTGKRRALIIGINYVFHPNQGYRLRSCIEDAYCMANYLHDHLGFEPKDILIMTDETPWNPPKKENILREMRALVYNAQPHDSFFFYFSGHAVRIYDLDGDASNGLDECICALDYLGDDPNPNPNTPGLIVDDVMHAIMVQPLPLQCRLTAIFDSCHSGTLLDLPYLYDSNGVVKEFRHPNRLGVLRVKSSYADVVALSASKAHQKALETRRGGALRWAFIDCMSTFRNDVTYKELVCYLREYMKKLSFPQRPQLSSSYEIDTNLRFIV